MYAFFGLCCKINLINLYSGVLKCNSPMWHKPKRIPPKEIEIQKNTISVFKCQRFTSTVLCGYKM